MNRYSISSSKRESVIRFITILTFIGAFICEFTNNTWRSVLDAFIDCYYPSQRSIMINPEGAKIIVHALLGMIPIGMYFLVSVLYNNIWWKCWPLTI